MRHRKSGRKLNRNSPQRASLKKGLAISIIEHESVKTTLAKAKEIKDYRRELDMETGLYSRHFTAVLDCGVEILQMHTIGIALCSLQ